MAASSQLNVVVVKDSTRSKFIQYDSKYLTENMPVILTGIMHNSLAYYVISNVRLIVEYCITSKKAIAKVEM